MTEKDLMIQDLQEENRKLKEKIVELEKDKWILADMKEIRIMVERISAEMKI